VPGMVLAGDDEERDGRARKLSKFVVSQIDGFGGCLVNLTCQERTGATERSDSGHGAGLKTPAVPICCIEILRSTLPSKNWQRPQPMGKRAGPLLPGRTVKQRRAQPMPTSRPGSFLQVYAPDANGFVFKHRKFADNHQ
jgi:hypothetical protein